MKEKFLIWDASEYFNAMQEAYEKKYGSDEEAINSMTQTFRKYSNEVLEEIADQLRSDRPEDDEALAIRMKLGVTEENGAKWIMFKLFNMQDLEKCLGIDLGS